MAISEASLNWFELVCGHQSEPTDLFYVTKMMWLRIFGLFFHSFHNTLQEHQMVLTNVTVSRNSDIVTF